MVRASIRAALVVLSVTPAFAQTPAPAAAVPPGQIRVTTETPALVAEWDRRLSAMARSGALKVREERKAAGSTSRDQWLVQLHKGVPVAGGEVWRRLEGNALVEADGTLFEHVDVSPVPKMTRAEIQAALGALVPGSPGPSRPPELVVLPTADGKYVLAYRARIFTGTDLIVYYLDAATGAVVLSEAAEGPPPPARR